MKNLKLITKLAFVCVLFSNNASAQLIGSGFNYQGQLNLSGATVNAPHVFTLKLFNAVSGGIQVGPTITRGAAIPPFIPESGVPVTDGLFNISNIDFGDQYSGDELWLEVTVKALDPIGCGALFPCPTPMTLAPRQRIHAVPYAVQADFIGPNFDISIGTTIATHRLTLQSDIDNKAFRIIGNDVNGSGARVNFGDGEFVYLDEPSDDRLTIHARLGVTMDADVKQPIASNGIMKYMVHATCGSSGSTIVKSYNGVSTANITIINNVTNPGRCTITFPDDISARYMQVSPLFGSPGRAASCRFSGTNNLLCTRFNPSTLSGANGDIMVLIY